MRIPRPFRALATAALLAAGAVLALAGPARAEEALVLDNGAILQGHVIRETEDALVFRLSGVGTDSRIEIRRDRIVKRFTTFDPTRRVAEADPSPELLRPPATESSTSVAPTPAPFPTPLPLPAEEPAPYQETFFARLLRLAALAFPRELPARAFLGLLGFVVVLCLVGLGARVADLEGMTLGRNTVLALAFAGLVAANAYWSDRVLRADVASWLIPAQLLAWVALASATVRCGIGRAVLLLAFVVFTGSIVAFASGALLVIV
jgi:hypothetical protein